MINHSKQKLYKQIDYVYETMWSKVCLVWLRAQLLRHSPRCVIRLFCWHGSDNALPLSPLCPLLFSEFVCTQHFAWRIHKTCTAIFQVPSSRWCIVFERRAQTVPSKLPVSWQTGNNATINTNSSEWQRTDLFWKIPRTSCALKYAQSIRIRRTTRARLGKLVNSSPLETREYDRMNRFCQWSGWRASEWLYLARERLCTKSAPISESEQCYFSAIRFSPPHLQR